MAANLLDGINPNLNQNLWGLVVSFISLGLSEYYTLCTLFWFSVIVSVIMTISVFITTIAYTYQYWKKKSN